jgi:DNA-binding MarR family transcriptional regulator
MPHIPSGAAFTQLTLLVFRLNGLLLDAGDRMTAPVGQTSARWQVMGVIDDEPMTVAGVARVMGLARQSVQRTADLLVNDGIAIYEDNPADRRAKLLRLTSSGTEALRAIEQAQYAWANQIGEVLGERKLLSANSTLEDLKAVLEGTET